ncbi:nucleotide sugar dehydrogenase [Planococcus sp. CAU13]|uniref:nucleotide sugar dehydrogenase n=1 Tax=Planococcus sp. CAU13 TaxID=1541197 RepID=UPI00052FDB12|nr:nucleotide sugar dehydrogenase [Planococcus sp. CAU13]
MRENLRIGVIGMSVAGLPIANDFARQYPVIVYDMEEEFNGDPAVDHAPFKVPYGSTIEVVQEPGRFSEAGLLIIAVPVTISASRHADLSLLLKACEVAGRNMKKGAVVVIASAVYPGATEEKCIPVLERHSGLEAGKHFFVGFTPETKRQEADISSVAKQRKIIAGQNDPVLDYLAEIYTSVYREQVFKAESIRIAEAAEFVTVIQQTVNNALMNELAAIFKLMDVDTQEVLQTAAVAKDFLNFSPGLSGNHGKMQNSYQLVQRALAVGHHPEILIAALRVNESVGNSIANAIIKEMNQLNLPLQSAAVVVLGVTNREDSAVIEKSRVFDMIEELQQFGLKIQVADSLADAEQTELQFGIRLTPWEELSPADAVILAMPHKEIRDGGWKLILALLKSQNSIVFDIKGVLDKNKKPEAVELWRL